MAEITQGLPPAEQGAGGKHGSDIPSGDRSRLSPSRNFLREITEQRSTDNDCENREKSLQANVLDREIHPGGEHDCGPNLFLPQGRKNRQTLPRPAATNRRWPDPRSIERLPPGKRIEMHRAPFADQRAVNLHHFILAVDRLVQAPSPGIDERRRERCGGPRSKLLQARKSAGARRSAKSHVADCKKNAGAKQSKAGDEAEMQIGPRLEK